MCICTHVFFKCIRTCTYDACVRIVYMHIYLNVSWIHINLVLPLKVLNFSTEPFHTLVHLIVFLVTILVVHLDTCYVLTFLSKTCGSRTVVTNCSNFGRSFGSMMSQSFLKLIDGTLAHRSLDPNPSSDSRCEFRESHDILFLNNFSVQFKMLQKSFGEPISAWRLPIFIWAISP